MIHSVQSSTFEYSDFDPSSIDIMGFKHKIDIDTNRPWSPEEDEKLIHATKKFGYQWRKISKFLEESYGIIKISTDCQTRFKTHLDPKLNKSPFVANKIKFIIYLQKKVGNRWSHIAKEVNKLSGKLNPSAPKGFYRQREQINFIFSQFSEFMKRNGSVVDLNSIPPAPKIENLDIDLSGWNYKTIQPRAKAWTKEEDECLLKEVNKLGTAWIKISHNLKLLSINRCPKSCQYRFTLYLNPCLDHSPFTITEQRYVITRFKQIEDIQAIKNKWKFIADELNHLKLNPLSSKGSCRNSSQLTSLIKNYKIHLNNKDKKRKIDSEEIPKAKKQRISECDSIQSAVMDVSALQQSPLTSSSSSLAAPMQISEIARQNDPKDSNVRGLSYLSIPPSLGQSDNFSFPFKFGLSHSFTNDPFMGLEWSDSLVMPEIPSSSYIVSSHSHQGIPEFDLNIESLDLPELPETDEL